MKSLTLNLRNRVMTCNVYVFMFMYLQTQVENLVKNNDSCAINREKSSNIT